MSGSSSVLLQTLLFGLDDELAIRWALSIRNFGALIELRSCVPSREQSVSAIQYARRPPAVVGESDTRSDTGSAKNIYERTKGYKTV